MSKFEFRTQLLNSEQGVDSPLLKGSMIISKAGSINESGVIELLVASLSFLSKCVLKGSQMIALS